MLLPLYGVMRGRLNVSFSLSAEKDGRMRAARHSGIDMLHIYKLVRDRRGATAIEYGLIAALIAVAAIGAMSKLGTQLNKTFNNVTTNMKA